MFKRVKLMFCLMLGGICALASCNLIKTIKPTTGGSDIPVTFIQQNNVDVVTIERYTIHLGQHQDELLQQLWREVDEQSLPPQLRMELLEQGFRVGILGSLLSPSLAQLLNVSSEGKTDTSAWEMQEVSVVEVVRGTVTKNVCDLVPEMRTLINMFNDQSMLPELTLFWKENGMYCGQTYRDAQGLICVSATANKDGSALIQIVPELEHGVLERQIRVRAAMVVHEDRRPRHTFRSLTVSQRLLPGQWLIIGTTTPDSAGAGKAFFVRQTPEPEQRLLAIRLVGATTAATMPAPSPSLLPSGTESAAMPERN
jgi:hypothetical protein